MDWSIAHAADTDSSGDLDLQEVQVFLSQHGVATPIEVERIFASFDSDGDGAIGLDEFESLVATVLERCK